MSVMNGFHHELMDKILGVNGHAFVQALETPFNDWEDVAAKMTKVKGVKAAVPMVEGAAGISSQFGQAGVLARGVREQDLANLPGVAGNLREGSFSASTRLAASPSVSASPTRSACASATR